MELLFLFQWQVSRPGGGKPAIGIDRKVPCCRRLELTAGQSPGSSGRNSSRSVSSEWVSVVIVLAPVVRVQQIEQQQIARLGRLAAAVAGQKHQAVAVTVTQALLALPGEQQPGPQLPGHPQP
ncbi:MAG: hypothetical protein OHK0022_09860 [Roseiflexaceae bacterium]